MNTQKLLHIFFLVLFGSIWLNNFTSVWAYENKSRVISGYWQSDSKSYTFMSVTHASLEGLATQIGLVVNAIQSDKTSFGTALTFTISSRETKRIFIARTNHPFLSPTTIPTASFIIGASDFQHGHIRIDPISSNPEIHEPSRSGFRDVTMLNFWGAVVIEANTTGFAMEFIGDMHDSGATPNMDNTVPVSGVN